MRTIKEALAHHQAGRFDDAEAGYKALLAVNPEDAEALHLYGVLEQQRGRLDPAILLMRRAIANKANAPMFHRNLGTALLASGDAKGAMECHRKALALNPQFPEAHHSLAEALRTIGQNQDAETHYRHAIRMKPSLVFAYNGLGLALVARGKLAEGEAQYRMALAQSPRFSQAMINLAHALEQQGRPKEAEAEFRRALKEDPKAVAALVNLGNLLKETGRTTEAAELYAEAIRINPRLAAAHNNLANLLKDSGRVEEALGHFRHAIALDPDFGAAHTNVLLTLHYAPGPTPEEIAEAHRRWGARTPAPAVVHANSREPDRQLRVGYLSPDLRRHPLASFIEPILAQHDRAKIVPVCFATHVKSDAVTKRLKALGHEWHEVAGQDDAALARRIAEAKIDILVELAGHTANHRLGVLARKPAPVIVNYLGYPDTVGLTQVDWRLTDAVADPPGETERFHVERLMRLPHCYLCYRPPLDAPEVGPLPQRAKGHVTFGSFNMLAKVNAPLIGRWSRILGAVPGSRLLLKGQPFRDDGVQRHFRDAFQRHGIEARRLDLRAYMPDARAHFGLYNEIDVALDTDPYNGATTTCDALWMGVPVVTRQGTAHVSRMASSLLTAAGLTETIARDANDYERIAVALAREPERLARLRADLRPRMAASPLCDGATFTRNLEDAYRAMWRTWCTSAP
jgi:predicted O-linked N-acetylglucosamine transferase (SPINDLY family)